MGYPTSAYGDTRARTRTHLHLQTYHWTPHIIRTPSLLFLTRLLYRSPQKDVTGTHLHAHAHMHTPQIHRWNHNRCWHWRNQANHGTHGHRHRRLARARLLVSQTPPKKKGRRNCCCRVCVCVSCQGKPYESYTFSSEQESRLGVPAPRL